LAIFLDGYCGVLPIMRGALVESYGGQIVDKIDTLVAEVSDPIAEIDRALDPWRMDRKLREVSVDEIVSVFYEAESLGKRAWIAMAICCGVAQERAGRGDGMMEKLAKAFSYDKSRIVRLARAYRDVIKPRLEQQGSNAQFPLVERGWYETAAENAKRLGVDPLELLEDAESKSVDNPHFTQRRWRSELGLTQTKSGLIAAMKTLSEVDRSDIDRLARSEDTKELVGKLQSLFAAGEGF
jgi:hypothetical protein